MLTSILTSALIASSVNTTALSPYNKYAVHNVVRNGVVYAEPFYGTASDYMSQGIVNSFHIYDVDVKNNVTPDLSQLFGLYNIYILDNGKKENLFTSTISITHNTNQPIEQQGNNIILKNCKGSDGNTYDVEVNCYSSDLADDFYQFFKSNDFSQISQLSNYKLKLDQLRTICQQVQDNKDWQSSFNQQVEDMDFQIGESEASFIVNVAGNPPTFYSPKDVFQYGNKLIAEGKLSGTGMQLNGNCSDLMELPKGQTYNSNLSGVLYNFSSKPKPVKQNEKTVAQIQAEQMQQYNKEKDKVKKTSQPQQTQQPQFSNPNNGQGVNLPIEFYTQPKTPFIIEVMEFFMRWIFVIIGVCVGIFAICLYMLFSDKKEDRKFNIDSEEELEYKEEHSNKKPDIRYNSSSQDEEFLDFKSKIDRQLHDDDDW